MMSESQKEDKKKRKRRDELEDGSSSSDRSRRKRKKSKKHKKKSKSSKTSKKKEKRLGPPRGAPPPNLLNPETDYFLYNKQLCLYLDTQGIVFDELSGQESRKEFSKFCQLYNAGKLANVFYQDRIDEPTATTRHEWSFHTSAFENERLRNLQHGVQRETEVPATQHAARPAKKEAPEPPPDFNNKQRSTSRAPKRRQDWETVAEEFGMTSSRDLPSSVAQRREAAARTHGASRHAGNVELTDSALYGSDEAGFRAAVAAQKQREAAKMEKKQNRVQDLQSKEAQKQKDMLEMLGLGDKIKTGEKIRIAPRSDG